MQETECQRNSDIQGFEISVKDKAALLLLVLTCFVFSDNSHADVGVTGTLEYIENLGRSEFTSSDLKRGVSVDANFERQTERFGLLLNYSASKEDYEKNIQQDRDYVQGAGIFTWSIIPDNLIWSLSDRRTNQTIQAFQPEIPDNEQIVDVISTGPALNFVIGGSNLLSINAELSKVDYEKFELSNNDRYHVSGKITHSFSEIFSGSIRSDFTDTEYERSQSNLDYELSSYSGSLLYDQTNYTIEIEAGEYRVRRKGQSAGKTPLISFLATYRLNLSSSVSFALSETVQDLASDPTSWYGYELDVSGGFGDELPSLGSSGANGLYILKTSAVTYNLNRDSRFNFSLSFRDEDREYENIGRKERWKSLSTTLGVPLGQSLNVRLQASMNEQSFSQVDERERASVSASLQYRPRDKLSFGLRLWVVDFKENEFSGPYNDYDDSGASVLVTYRFGDF